MSETATCEFPFVQSMPIRQKSKLARLWDHLATVKRVTDEKGPIVPQHLVSELLNLSKQRIAQILDDGRLEAVEVNGVRYVTVKSVEVFAQMERKTGRPVKDPGKKATWSSALQSAREIVKNTSK